MSVEWEIFVWTIGTITALFTMVIGYLSKKLNDACSNFEITNKNVDSRLDEMERCHTENQVNLAKINKDIEYIKVQQQDISLKLDELLKKSWCKQDK